MPTDTLHKANAIVAAYRERGLADDDALFTTYTINGAAALTVADLAWLAQVAADCRDAENKADAAAAIVRAARSTMGALGHMMDDAQLLTALTNLRADYIARCVALDKTCAALELTPGSRPLDAIATEAMKLRRFATATADLFGLPINCDLGDLLTTVSHGRNNHLELSDMVRGLGEAVGLRQATSSAILEAAKDMSLRSKNARANSDSAFRVLGMVREALGAEEGDDIVKKAGGLMEQVRRERESRRQAQAELADLKAHCLRIESENQRYRGSTLDAKAGHERRNQPDACDEMAGLPMLSEEPPKPAPALLFRGHVFTHIHLGPAGGAGSTGQLVTSEAC